MFVKKLIHSRRKYMIYPDIDIYYSSKLEQ